jgi:hypothetical protein
MPIVDFIHFQRVWPVKLSTVFLRDARGASLHGPGARPSPGAATAGLPGSLKPSGALDERLSLRPAIFRPRLAVHLDQELAVVGERNPGKLDFEIFLSLKIFDRNSNVRFYKFILGFLLSPLWCHFKIVFYVAG